MIGGVFEIFRRQIREAETFAVLNLHQDQIGYRRPSTVTVFPSPRLLGIKI